MADYEGAGDEDGGHDAASPGRDRAQSLLALTTQEGDGLPTLVADGRLALMKAAGSAVTVLVMKAGVVPAARHHR